MDKLKGIAKHGVHPTGDHEIHRKTLKTDVKNIALRRDPNKAHLDAARSHQSAPLSTLQDPDSFGPPPKHTGASGSSSSSIAPAAPPRQQPSQQPAQQPRKAPGGWGAPVPAPRRRQEEEEEEEAAPPLPYRTDTTGLRTDNLPKPPARRVVEEDGQPPAAPPRNASPASPALPMRPQQQQHPLTDGPAPGLPPRMNEHPDEFTPPAPPSYHESAKQAAAPLLNQGALNRLGKAGVSVPGLDIGHSGQEASGSTPTSIQGHAGQLSELQQRFARMNAGANSDSPSSPAPTVSSLRATAATAAAAAKKAPPPPPPPKKPGLAGATASRPSTADDSNAPPPLPFASKPRPS